MTLRPVPRSAPPAAECCGLAPFWVRSGLQPCVSNWPPPLPRFVTRREADKDERNAGPFTSDEAASLVRRFAHVDRELRSKSGAQWSPGFQIKGPLDYELVDMPAGVGVGALVESWSESPVEARTPDGHSYR